MAVSRQLLPLTLATLRGGLTNSLSAVPLPSHRCAALGSFISGMSLTSESPSNFVGVRQYSVKYIPNNAATPNKWKDAQQRVEYFRNKKVGLKPRFKYPAIIDTENSHELGRLVQAQSHSWSLKHLAIALTHAIKLLNVAANQSSSPTGAILALRRLLGLRMSLSDTADILNLPVASHESVSPEEFLKTPVANEPFDFSASASSSAPAAEKQAEKLAAASDADVQDSPAYLDEEARRERYKLIDAHMRRVIATNPGLVLGNYSLEFEGVGQYRLSDVDRLGGIIAIIASNFCARFTEAEDKEAAYALNMLAHVRYLLPPIYDVVAPFAAFRCERVANSSPAVLAGLLKIVAGMHEQAGFDQPTASSIMNIVPPVELAVLKRLGDVAPSLEADVLSNTLFSVFVILRSTDPAPNAEVAAAAKTLLNIIKEELVARRFIGFSVVILDVAIKSFLTGQRAGIADGVVDEHLLAALTNVMVTEGMVRRMKKFQLQRALEFVTNIENEGKIDVPASLIANIQVQLEKFAHETPSAASASASSEQQAN